MKKVDLEIEVNDDVRIHIEVGKSETSDENYIEIYGPGNHTKRIRFDKDWIMQRDRYGNY